MNVLTGNTEIVFRASVFGALAMAMVVSNVAHADGLVKDSEPKAVSYTHLTLPTTPYV